MLEIGLITFADMEPDSSGKKAHQRLKDLMEEIVLADQLGFDVFGVGEHHREDYAVSAPAVVLGAAATATKKIKLSSAVTVLSSDEPVRVYQNFSTIDHLSDGRAEIMVGRGSFTESFPLFGYSLNDYDRLFEEKLDLLLRINQDEIISWQGTLRAPIKELGVYPRSLQNPLPIWIAAGGTPSSALRAAKLKLPLMLAIIGGMPEQFVKFINLYKENFKGENLNFGVNNHLYVGEDAQKAADEFFPYYATMMNRVGRDRGWSPLTREQYEYMRSPKASLMVGSVQQVIDKILYEHELFGFTRFMAQASVGNVPHALTMKSIELFGTKVAPVVRKAIG